MLFRLSHSYDMMKACWEVDPKSRPKFKDLADKLEAILNDSHYEERAKTKEIESDYYKEALDKSDLNDLYVEVIEWDSCINFGSWNS